MRGPLSQNGKKHFLNKPFSQIQGMGNRAFQIDFVVFRLPCKALHMFNEAQDALSSDFSLSESNPILFGGLNQSADQFSMPNFLSGKIVPEYAFSAKLAANI